MSPCSSTISILPFPPVTLLTASRVLAHLIHSSFSPGHLPAEAPSIPGKHNLDFWSGRKHKTESVKSWSVIIYYETTLVGSRSSSRDLHQNQKPHSKFWKYFGVLQTWNFSMTLRGSHNIITVLIPEMFFICLLWENKIITGATHSPAPHPTTFQDMNHRKWKHFSGPVPPVSSGREAAGREETHRLAPWSSCLDTARRSLGMWVLQCPIGFSGTSSPNPTKLM